ncbi:MAG: hypothetical protein NTZ12_09300 [Candidatus Aminicenantes bacterium]|nr:hypothetical protein [Candidatus Aminicenantes bacterium]
MLNPIFFYLAAFFVFAWGIAHLFPTKGVLRGFGEITADNRRIIAMEWIVEGAALIFIGLLVAAVTAVGHNSPAAQAVYWLSFAMLNALSLISLFTGFKVHLIPFKLCPVIFTGSSLLILLGIVL